ncbi:MAG TPA: serine/threonine-protein kinase [Iamia sp.]|nr:serine/threonine-protein kinase [Iamia sp.]
MGPPAVPGYVLHDVLGRSGSATTYRATQTSVDRPAAVKVFAGALPAADEARFRTEVRALAALADHPHVVGVIDAGTTTTGAPFVAMELVPAGSLGDRLRAFGPLPPTEVARVGSEVADALEAAHAAGIVHGDITPDDVLVGRRGRALLTDFAITALRPAGAAPPTPADDVLTLGATLHTLLAGEPPTDDVSPLPPEVPFPLVDLVGACLAPDPTDRPSLRQVATRLEAVAATAPIPPPTPTATLDDPSEDGAGTAAHAEAAAPAGPAPAAPVRRAPAGAVFPATRHIVVAVLIAVSLVAAVVVALVFGD